MTAGRHIDWNPAHPAARRGPTDPQHYPERGTVSRRQLLALLGAAGVGAAGATAMKLPGHGRGGGTAVDARTPPSPGSSEVTVVPDVVPFYGRAQAGIATPQPTDLSFASIDVRDASRSELRDLLRTWTEAAARLTQGRPASAGPGGREDPPGDTGEAIGLPAADLTITFGVGPSLFENRRVGLAAARPKALVDLPAFSVDRLEPARTGGDLCIQACANDGQVAFHAVRELLRLGHGLVAPRWTQAGFLPGMRGGQSPRNLMGFKDGTNNLRGSDAASLARYVWVGAEGPAWLRGGSYAVVRRIRVHLEAWDATGLDEQEDVFGRHKLSGAPFGGSHEHDTVRLDSMRPNGKPVIPLDAHIRQAGPASNGGERILRRGFSYADGTDAEGRLDAGLFFVAYQRDPRRQFVPIQQRLSRSDALNEYIQHTGSAVFAMFPGVQPGDFIGRRLF